MPTAACELCDLFFLFFFSPLVWLNGCCMMLTMSILLVIHHRPSRSFTPALEIPSP